MVVSARYAKMADTCRCRNMICGIVCGALGVLLAIAGGIILGVGFGTLPIDIWDTPNMAKRISGMIMVGGGILLINIAVISILFYVKRSSFDKTITKPIYMDKSRQWVRGGVGGGGASRDVEELKVPLDDDYTSGAQGGSQIYRGGGMPLLAVTPGDNDSVFKFNSSRQDDSSLSSMPVPINRSAGSPSDSKIIETGSHKGVPSSHKTFNPPLSNRPTPSPRPPSVDTTLKNPSTTSSAATSRDTKPSRGRAVVGSGSETEDHLPPTQSRPRAGNYNLRSQEAAAAPVVEPVSYKPLHTDDMVSEVTVSVKSVAKKKKKSGKAKSAPAPEDMYGGLAEGEEPIPPRVIRGGHAGGTATPDTILMSSDIEDDYGPEEELAPPPPTSRHHRSNVR